MCHREKNSNKEAERDSVRQRKLEEKQIKSKDGEKSQMAID